MKPIDDVVVLEWTYSPPNYFEEAIRLDSENYTIIIENGKVEARIDPAAYDKEDKMRDELHDAINDRFLGVQLLTYEPYTLSKASMFRLYPDGHKDITIFLEPIASTMAFGTLDLVVKDRDGNILRDSRKDRIEKKKGFSELVAKYRKHDKYLQSMLSFFDTAIHDPENELIHLYDVWEAIKKRFGGRSIALTALKMNDSERKTLGRLANNEPLRQGRHRGTNVGELRDATEAELKEARSIVQKMIEAYLYYLESENIS